MRTFSVEKSLGYILIWSKAGNENTACTIKLHYILSELNYSVLFILDTKIPRFIILKVVTAFVRNLHIKVCKICYSVIFQPRENITLQIFLKTFFHALHHWNKNNDSQNPIGLLCLLVITKIPPTKVTNSAASFRFVSWRSITRNNNGLCRKARSKS